MALLVTNPWHTDTFKGGVCMDGHEAGELGLNKSGFAPGWVLTGRLPARDRRKVSTAAAAQGDG